MCRAFICNFYCSHVHSARALLENRRLQVNGENQRADVLKFFIIATAEQLLFIWITRERVIKVFYFLRLIDTEVLQDPRQGD